MILLKVMVLEVLILGEFGFHLIPLFFFNTRKLIL